VEIRIVPADKSDFEGILSIMNHEIKYETSNFSHTLFTLDDLTNYISDRINAGFPFLVAKRGNQVVGYGSFGKFRFREGYNCTIEHSVYVDHTQQGLGIGKKLFLALKEIATNEGYTSMIAGIGDENQGSIDFHKRMGFEVVGRIPRVARKFDRDLNLVFMQLFL
jgi:phosphinothricin acetyltransferase